MPIRFRCPKCGGLLSISRRKAGTRIACPNCGISSTVPLADDPALSNFGRPMPVRRATNSAATPAAVKVRAANRKTPVKPPDNPASEPLFERPDFVKLLDPKAKGRVGPNTASPAAPAPATPHPMIADEGGFYVSRGAVAVLGVMLVVLLALAFATGFLLGS